MRTMRPATPELSAATEQRSSFEQFFRDVYPRLARAALLLTGGESEAEELAQEAMARVLTRWERIRMMKSPEGYAYRTALNLARKRARTAKVRARVQAPIRSPESDPAATLGERDRILRALMRIGERGRAAVVLVDWLGMDTDEAARLLRIDRSTVRVRLHRARKRLRDLLGADDA